MIMKKQDYPQESEELLAGYVLGDLEPEEVTAMHQLIAEHPQIITEIDRLQETLSLLPLGLRESYPTSELRDRIAAIAIPSVVGEVPLREPLTKRSLRPDHQTEHQKNHQKNIGKLAGFGLGAISAIALVTLGFDNYQMRQQVATNQIELQKYRQAIALLQTADNRMISLKGMGAIPAAFGNVIIAPSEKTAMISIQNLRQVSQESSYQLWAIVDGKKLACAQFRPDQQGKVLVKVPLSNALRQSTTVIITLEPNNIEPNKDMAEPTGEMVMKGEA
jgi:anti-sigma-K factor RskA